MKPRAPAFPGDFPGGGLGSGEVPWWAGALAGLLAVWLGFLAFDASVAARVVTHAGHGIMTLTMLLTLFTVVRMWREDGGAWPGKALWARDWRAAGRAWRGDPWGRFTRSLVLMVAAGTLLCALAEPAGYKVLFDEYVLQITAAQMHLTREVGTMVRAYDIEGVWLPLSLYVDKRPYFFAYVLSGLHDVTGFRQANAFILNHGLTAVLLALVYGVVRRLTGRAECGVLAGWLLAGLPLLGQNTNGSGMELLNVVMIVLAMGLGMRLVARPTLARQDGFLLVVVLLAQCRYESALYVLLAGGVLAMAWVRTGRMRLSVITLLVPLLLLPVAWLHQVFGENQIFWQLPDHLLTPFGQVHVPDNFDHAASYLFSFDPGYSNSWLLTLAGGGCLVGLLVAWLVRRRHLGRRREVAVVGWWAVGIVANLVLLMHYFWGQLDDPLVSRLSLPFQVLLAMAVAGAMGWLEKTGRPFARWGLAVALLSLPLIYGRAVPQYAYTQENILEQEIRWEMDWVAQRPPGPRMVVTNKTNLVWLLERTPALLIPAASLRGEAFQFHLEAGTFDEILVMQRWRATTPEGDFSLDAEEALPEHFRLELLTQRRFGVTLATISRLVAIDAPSGADEAGEAKTTLTGEGAS